jgi:hypothetical protein
LLKQINRLSPRKKPPLSMVDRDNTFNKQLAILLARLSGRYGKQKRAGNDDRRAAKQLRLAKQG